MDDVGNRWYVAFVAPRRDDPSDDARVQAQVDVVNRWWTAGAAPHLLSASGQPGSTTRHTLSSLVDRLSQISAGAGVAVYLTGHGDTGPTSSEYRLHVDAGTYDPAGLVEAIWDCAADDALVVLDSRHASRFVQRAQNLYDDRVRQPGRTPPRTVLVVPGAPSGATAWRPDDLTSVLDAALRLVRRDETGQVGPYTPPDGEPHLSPARLRAALAAATAELVGAGRAGLTVPQVVTFPAGSDEPSLALPNPAYDPAAPAAGPATADLTMSAQAVAAYAKLGWAGADHISSHTPTRRDLGIIACGSFVVGGDGQGMDRPLLSSDEVVEALAAATAAAEALPPKPDNPAWFFTSRATVMTPVVQWLAGTDTHQLLVVTGARGTGASALLARAVTLADPHFATWYPAVAAVVPPALVPPPGAVHVAVDARGRTAEHVAALVIAALGTRCDTLGLSTYEGLAVHLRAVVPGAPVCVVVDSVDESADPQSLVDDVIAALVRTCGPDGVPVARVMVAVRDDEGRGVVRAVQSLAEHTSVCTDDDAAAQVRAACLRVLRRPGSPYHDRPGDATAVADLLVRRDRPSFVDTGIVAQSLAAAEHVADHTGMDPTGDILPAALRHVLSEQQRATGRPAAVWLAVLRALAFARGAGTPWGVVWPALASAVAEADLGNDVLRALLAGPLAALVTTGVDDGQRVLRLAHTSVARLVRDQPGALAEDVVAEPDHVVQARIARHLSALVDDNPNPYLARHLVAHATAGHVLTDQTVPARFLPASTGGDLRAALGLPAPTGPATSTLAAWTGVEAELDQVPALARGRQALRFALLPTSGTGGPDGWRTWTDQANTLARAHGPVNALAFAQVAGRTVLAGAVGDRVCLWDPASGRRVGHQLRGHDGPVHAAVFAQVAGRPLLVTGGQDRTARIWDPATGAQLHVLRQHAGAVLAVAFGRVGGRPVLATGSADQTAQLWDLALDGGPPVAHEPLPHRGQVSAVAFGTVDGATTLATGCTDGTARLWDPVANHRLDGPLRHGDRVLAVTFGPVGASGTAPLATSSDDGSVCVWDPLTGALVGRASHRGVVGALAFGSADGRVLLATAGADSTARLWDVSGLSWNAVDEAVLTAVAGPLWGHTGAVRALAFGQVGTRTVLVTGGDDLTVRVWDPRGHVTQPWCLPDDQAPGAGGLRPGDASVDEPPQPPGHVPTAEQLRDVEALEAELFGDLDPDELAAIRLGPPPTHDGTDLSSVADARTPRQGLHTVAAGDRSSGLVAPVRAVRTVAFGTVDGTTVLATGGDDHVVRLWDATTGEVLGPGLRGHTGPVVAVAFGSAGAGTLLATASQDGTVQVWDATTGEPVSTPVAVPALAVTFTHVAGRYVVVAAGPGHVSAWDPPTRRPVGRSWGGPLDSVRTVAFGEVAGAVVVATGGGDGTVQLWDAGGPRARLVGHEGPVASAVFGTVDGAPVLATGAGDGTARVWDPTTGEPVGVLTGHGGAVHAMALGTVAGTTVLATARADRTVRLWNPATGRHVGDPVPVLVKVSAMAFAPDGRLALATDAGTAVVGDGVLVGPWHQ